MDLFGFARAESHRVEASFDAGLAAPNAGSFRKRCCRHVSVFLLLGRHSGEGRNPGKVLPGCLDEFRLFPVRAAITTH